MATREQAIVVARTRSRQHDPALLAGCLPEDHHALPEASSVSMAGASTGFEKRYPWP